jgi:peptidyl-prolyl cis-trans isomerase D
MLRSFRGLANTWAARILFFALAGAFAFWGVANKNPFGSDQTAVATVAGTRIEAPEVDQTYRQMLARVAQRLGNPSEVPADIRRAVVEQALDQLIMRQALRQKERELGIVVPDGVLRDAAFAVPQFQNADGRFDHAVMENVLRANGLTEQHFLADLDQQKRDQELLEAVSAGAVAPDTLVREVFEYQNETRVADAVDLRFSAAPPPAEPTEEELRRWYDNHPSLYSSPEYRRIKAVILTPETVAPDIAVGDDELRAAYDQRKGELVSPERRTVQVITVPDQAQAQNLAAQWSIGAEWDTMQKAAQAQGGTSTEYDAVSKSELPEPAVADAAFTTAADTVALPVHGETGWSVVRVAKVDPAGPETFDQAKEQLRSRIVADKAADVIDKEASELEDEFAGGTTLDDKLPSNLKGEAGTLDAKGMTPAGTPAPLLGSPSLREAMIAAAFAAHKGDPLKMVQAPSSDPNAPPSYFALTVEDILPPAPKPYDQVKDAVRADWMRDAMHREQDAAATKLLTAVQGGAKLADAAASAGLAVHALPPVGRMRQADGVPASLTAPLFGMKKGEATMVETPDGFVVAVLADITDPDPKTDPIGYARLREELNGALANDTQASYAFALRNEVHPRVNRALLDQITQAGE